MTTAQTVARPTRSAAIDAVRVLGIVAIIVGHTWTTGPGNRLVYTWQVPVFFFLTGWLWRSNRSLRSELISRFRSMVVPYLVWAVIIAVPFLARMQEPAGQVAKNLIWGGDHLQRPWYAFWFVGALFFACLLRRVLDPLGLRAITVIAVVCVVIGIVAGSQLANTPESVGVAVLALPFMVAGEWCSSVRVSRSALVGGAMVTVSVVLVFVAPLNDMTLKYGQVGTPVVMYVLAVAISWGLVLLAKAAEPHVSEAVSAAAIRLGEIGLLVVLAHGIALWSISNRPVAFIVALIVPWGLALLVSQAPLTRAGWLLIGWPKQRSSQSREPVQA